MKFKRIFLIVLDSVGIGNAKDAYKYGDENANTLLHVIEKTNVELPYLKAMGLHNLVDKSNNFTNAYYTRANELSNGKDTLTGHLEMMGIKTDIPLKTFTETGFPRELIQELEEKTGRKVIGNVSASGTEIIERLGEEHIKTGSIIVYTSADSVLQIAAHESIIPINELYRICKIARKITLNDEWKVGRIIARPFVGKPNAFERTSNRHDYALDPSGITILDNLKEVKLDVISIGKISDIFNEHGITNQVKTKDNLDGINKIKEYIQTDFNGLCFTNLNDFDSKYGHRRDVFGYARALKEFDDNIESILALLRYDDLLMIVADHGNDPTHRGTDHTRENVPVLVYSKLFIEPKHLDELNSFADIGATIAENFNIKQTDIGTSFLDKLK
jgi:phosphopentomutase